MYRAKVDVEGGTFTKEFAGIDDAIAWVLQRVGQLNEGFTVTGLSVREVKTRKKRTTKK